MKSNSYQTRQLVALRDMRHDGQTVVDGGEVFATETDANYLIRAGHARDPKAVAAAPAPAPNAPRRPGRPSKAELTSRAQAPAVIGSALMSTSNESGLVGQDAAGDAPKNDEGDGDADGAGKSGDE